MNRRDFLRLAAEAVAVAAMTPLLPSSIERAGFQPEALMTIDCAPFQPREILLFERGMFRYVTLNDAVLERVPINAIEANRTYDLIAHDDGSIEARAWERDDARGYALPIGYRGTARESS